MSEEKNPKNQPKTNIKPSHIREIKRYSNGGSIGESKAQQETLKKGAELTPRPITPKK